MNIRKLNYDERQKVRQLTLCGYKYDLIAELTGFKLVDIIQSVLDHMDFYNIELGTHLGHKNEPYWTEKEMIEPLLYNTYSLSESEKEILEKLNLKTE